MKIADIRFAPAKPSLRARGLVGWVCLVIDDEYRLDGLGVRRTDDGRYAVSFPSRRDANGVEHSVYRPLTQAARDAIEVPVLDNLRRRGFIT